MPVKKNLNDVMKESVLTENRSNMGRRAASTFTGSGIPDLQEDSSVPVKSIPLDRIHERNVNDFSDLPTVELEESIYDYSLINPITVVQKDGESDYTISAGHRRFMAVTNLHHRYPDDPRFESIDCRVYILTDKPMKLSMGFPYISADQEESIYSESNLLSRQLTYADVAHQIRQIVSRLDDDDYREKLRKSAEEKGIHTYSDPNRVSLIMSVLSSQNYHGWKKETIRQYLKVYDSGNEELLDRIENDPNYKVHTAYKKIIEEENHSRSKTTNRLLSLKRSVRSFVKEADEGTHAYSEKDMDDLKEIISSLEEIVRKNDQKTSE